MLRVSSVQRGNSQDGLGPVVARLNAGGNAAAISPNVIKDTSGGMYSAMKHRMLSTNRYAHSVRLTTGSGAAVSSRMRSSQLTIVD